MNHLSVAIADDNQKILDLLEKVIGTDQELDLVGKAKNGEEMCRIIKEKNPDVVLLDLIMPKMDGLTVMIRSIRIKVSVNVHILLLLQRWDRKRLQKMLLIKVQITIL